MTHTSLPSSRPSLWHYLRNRLVHYPLRSELTGIVMLGFVGLFLLAVAPHLAPDTPLRHLDQGRVHVAAGFVCCSFVFLILRAFFRAFVGLCVGLALMASLLQFAGTYVAQPTPNRSSDLSLISFNVLGVNPHGDALADFFIQESPDIAFVLEAPALFDQLERMRSAFPYSVGCDPQDPCDLVVFSQHPLLDVQILPFFSFPGRLVVLRLDLDAGPVTLVAAHLTKPYYGDWHDRQLQQLASVLEEIDGPVVMAGDFNSQPFVRAFRRVLLDRSQLQLASAMQQTWPALSLPGSRFLGFAIDHVLVRGDITPVSVAVMDDSIGSNHRGFVSHFDLDGE